MTEGAPGNKHNDRENKEGGQPSDFSKLRYKFGPAFEDEDGAGEVTPETPTKSTESVTPESGFDEEKLKSEFAASIENALKDADKRNKEKVGAEKPVDGKPKTTLPSRIQKRIDKAKSRKTNIPTAAPSTSTPTQGGAVETKLTANSTEVPAVAPVSAATNTTEAPKESGRKNTLTLKEVRRMLDTKENQDPEKLKVFIEELETMQVKRGDSLEKVPESLIATAKERLANLKLPEPAVVQEVATQVHEETNTEKGGDRDENKGNQSGGNRVTIKEFGNLIPLHKKNSDIDSLRALKRTLMRRGMTNTRGGERIDAEPYIGQIDEAIKEILSRKAENASSDEKAVSEKKKENAPISKQSRKDVPKSYKDLVARLKEIGTEEELHKTKNHLLRVGILTESGKVKKFEPGSQEEAAFLSDIDALYDKLHPIKTKRSNKQIEEAVERDTTSRYAPHKRKDYEDSSRDAVGMKENPVDAQKVRAKAPRIPTPLNAPKVPVIPARTNPVIDIENLFNYPRPSSYIFQSIEQALNEPGFAEFIQQHDKYNKTKSEVAIENGDEAAVEQLYYTYMNARSMSEHVQNIFKQELLKDLGDEITLPDEAAKAIEKHFSHLCVENPAEIEILTEKVQEFLDLPGKISAEEAKIEAELTAVGGSHQGGIETLMDRLNINREKKQRLSELKKFKELMDTNKGVGYFAKAEEASKLIREGVLTGRFGYDKDYPFAHLFRPAEKIQRAIDKLTNDIRLEHAKLGDIHGKLSDSRAAKKELHAKYLEIKRLILSELGPSEIVKKAITKAIKEKIKSQIEDPHLRFNKSEKAQSLLEKARNASDLSLSLGYGIDYFTEEQAEETQKEIANAIKAEVGAQIDTVIQKTPLGVDAYTKLKQGLLNWLASVNASGQRIGSKQGAEAQRFIIEVMEEKMATLEGNKTLNPKRYLLGLFLAQIRKNEIPGLSKKS